MARKLDAAAALLTVLPVLSRETAECPLGAVARTGNTHFNCAQKFKGPRRQGAYKERMTFNNLLLIL